MKYKYANYEYKGKYCNNIGDYIQIISIDYLYSVMEVKKEDIVYIPLDDLSVYKGPQVLLPVSMPLVRHCKNGIAGMFSENITPVFFGLTMVKESLLECEVEYLKKYSPIGCRDERTYHTMKKYGIDAYLNGCLTIALPSRKSDNGEFVYFVDAPEDVKKYIPEGYHHKIKNKTHMYYGNLENHMSFTRNQYKEYIDNASLVVTSLLHCAIPCLAFGIPVILTKSYVSYRFSWCDKIIKIYTPDKYSTIDWQPDKIDVKWVKEIITSIFIKRINMDDATVEMQQIHDYYMNRQRCDYIVDGFISIKKFLSHEWTCKEKIYKYSIWGLTQFADYTVEYISENYPNARFQNVYDVRSDMQFLSKQVLHPDDLVLDDDEYIFVTAIGAVEAARVLLKKKYIQPNRYCMLERTI